MRFLWVVSGEFKVESLLRLDLHFASFLGEFVMVSFVRQKEMLYCWLCLQSEGDCTCLETVF
jgi:hypothetical protein